MKSTLFSIFLALTVFLGTTAVTLSAAGADLRSVIDDPDTDIQIVAGQDKTVFEYRSGGVLLIIKVVPKTGKPYYMVPADGSPHYEGLEGNKGLYPQWVLFEF